MARWEPYLFAEGELAALFARGDGLEVSPVARVGMMYETCDDGDETMWSVYVHVTGEGVHCIGDWIVDESDPRGLATAQAAAFTEANAMAHKLLDRHPQLREHGINCSTEG